MRKTRKKPFLQNGSNQYIKNQSVDDSTSNGRGFQYLCSFCWRELTDGGIRFDGIGACPVHFAVAKRLIDGLRRNRRVYRTKFTKQIKSAEVAAI